MCERGVCYLAVRHPIPTRRIHATPLTEGNMFNASFYYHAHLGTGLKDGLYNARSPLNIIMDNIIVSNTIEKHSTL